jgi:hypothetical protein
MIEFAMVFVVGFMTATVIGVAVISLVHKRAVRLTTERLMGEKKNLTRGSDV